MINYCAPKTISVPKVKLMKMLRVWRQPLLQKETEKQMVWFTEWALFQLVASNRLNSLEIISKMHGGRYRDKEALVFHGTKFTF